MAKEKKKKTYKPVPKFDDDQVSNALIGRWGDIIESGSTVLEEIKDLKTISISPALDMALGGGLREGSIAVMTGDPKAGKEQPLSATVYTPSGPKKMGELQPGDNVCTPDGQFSYIEVIYPQGMKDIYRITFNDGCTVECGLEHLWKVKRNNSRKGKHYDWMVLSLKDILDEGLSYSDRAKWRIPLTSPVQFNSIQQSIPAYILGCLVGDGGLTNGTPIITSADKEIVDAFDKYAKFIGLNCKYKEQYDYALSHPDNKTGDNHLTNCLRDMKLMGCGSHDKFIPYDYKYGSIDQRISLIQGLMDTDGYNDKGKNAEYSTVSEKLAKDVQEVLQSLGYTAKIKPRVTKCNGKEFPSFRLHISGYCISDLFSLPRKKINRSRIKNQLTRTIKKVEKVRREECQCIKIAHKDHLYLTDNFVVTHNTTTALHFASKCQAVGKSVYYFNTEGRITKENFTGVAGLDVDNIKIVQATTAAPVVSAESYLNSLEAHVKGTPNFVAIIDSVSNMVPEVELEGEIRSNVRNGLPRLLSMFFKRASGDVGRTGAILIFITHNIANTGGNPYAPSKMADCGNMLQYQAGTNMIITGRGRWTDGEDGPHIGQVVNWNIKTSAAGGTPNTPAKGWLRYGIGIDECKEMIHVGVDFAFIKKAGSWYTLTCLVNHKKDKSIKKLLKDNEVDIEDDEAVTKFFQKQGEAKMWEFIDSNPVVYEVLKEEMKEYV